MLPAIILPSNCDVAAGCATRWQSTTGTEGYFEQTLSVHHQFCADTDMLLVIGMLTVWLLYNRVAVI